MEISTKKHIITIGGLLGSGKSSTAKLVAKRLNYKHYSAGDLMRQLAKENGIEDIRTFNLTHKDDDKFDRMVDDRTRQVGETENDIVFDGHMAWYFIPQSFKVFLDLSEEDAARRIITNLDEARKSSEEIADDLDGYVKQLIERKEGNIKRYDAIYGVNPYLSDKFDLVIRTKDYSLEKVAEAVIVAYQEWLHG